jgi:hypothetical protein
VTSTIRVAYDRNAPAYRPFRLLEAPPKADILSRRLRAGRIVEQKAPELYRRAGEDQTENSYTIVSAISFGAGQQRKIHLAS